MHHRILFPIFVLAAFAAPAHAAEVYRCIAPDGTATYRDTTCPVGFVLSRTYGAKDDAAIAEQAQRDAKYLDMGRSWTAMQDAAAPPRTQARDDRRTRCTAARDERDRILRVVGLERNFELLRDLDEDVYDACKGL